MHQDSEAMATHCYWYYSVTCGQTPAKRYKYGVEVGSQCSSKLPLTPYTKSTRIWNHASTSLRVKGADGRLNATSSQRLQELLTNTDWDEQAFNARRVEHLLRSTACEDGSIIIDDTGILKQGKGVVGVARQYFGTLGKVGNCQVVVSLQYADARDTWPVNARLYLPREWTDDPERCRKAHVPDNLVFDSGHGGYQPFLEKLEVRHKHYVGGVPCDFRVRLPEGHVRVVLHRLQPYDAVCVQEP